MSARLVAEVRGFLQVLCFPPPIKLTATKILLNVALNTKTLTLGMASLLTFQKERFFAIIQYIVQCSWSIALYVVPVVSCKDERYNKIAFSSNICWLYIVILQILHWNPASCHNVRYTFTKHVTQSLRKLLLSMLLVVFWIFN